MMQWRNSLQNQEDIGHGMQLESTMTSYFQEIYGTWDSNEAYQPSEGHEDIILETWSSGECVCVRQLIAYHSDMHSGVRSQRSQHHRATSEAAG